MKIITNILFILLTIGLLGRAEAEEERILARGDFSVKGLEYHVELRSSDLVDAPDWIMGKEEPVITANQAYLIAKAKLDEMFPGMKDVQCYSVNLSRSLDEKGNRHALYHIFFTSPDIDTKQRGGLLLCGGISFYLPLNGKLIEPHLLEEKESKPDADGDGELEHNN